MTFHLHEQNGVTRLTLNGNEMVLVNKIYALPIDYGDGIQPEAQAAYDAMIRAAGNAGYANLMLVSGYRSYAYQKNLHNRYLLSGDWSAEEVKQMSAEAGHSEHQLGLAFDISDQGALYEDFGGTGAGLWLSSHCADYGFILRYPEGKAWATGYTYEPWHFRYVGVELAKLIHRSGLCVEELIKHLCVSPSATS